MSGFILKTESRSGITGIPNIFLDFYMPKANGEYVKVYLYLLRALQGKSEKLSVAGLADVLDHTENDILRALKYWEKQGLLRLECGEDHSLLGIYLLELSLPNEDTKLLKAASEPQTDSAVPPRKSYSPDELLHFSRQSEYKQLIFVCEQYMGKTLTPSEIETFFYFHDQLHFSSDLIEYLVEYCVCKGSRSIHYIETVALAWAKAGVSTVAQAKERTTTYRRGCFAILKAFGINDRNPAEPELKYMEKWLNDGNFTLELVLEACNRTMSRLHKPNFEYTDKILKSWAENQVHHMEDVRALDLAHQKKAEARTQTPSSQSGTRFTNFEQRNYDFEELEKQLIQNS